MAWKIVGETPNFLENTEKTPEIAILKNVICREKKRKTDGPT